MKARAVKFNRTKQPEFFKTVRGRVNSYFKENNITKYANSEMKFKTVFMISLYFVPFIFILTGVISSYWLVLIMWALMGVGMSGIGLSIMHDANHGSYSKTKWINTILGKLILFIGGYSINWKIQHNVLHHSFTNVDGYDEDINAPVLRMAPNQKRKMLHKYQAYYVTLVYGIMTIYWATIKDFKDLVKFSKKGLLKAHGLTLNVAMIQMISNKISYFALTFVVPILITPYTWGEVFIGFIVMHIICGLALALIFQPAHVTEETQFFMPDENGKMDNNWAIHQMKTTSNFAQENRLFSWFVGGLNYQVEHHLFPNICHVHYRKISKIVKQTAKEFNIPYLQHKTWLGALRSHYSTLNRLGRGLYKGPIIRN